MKIKIDSILRAEVLVGATQDKPMKGKIVFISFIEAKDLPFKSEDGKYELTVSIGAETYEWLPNKTSLKTIVASLGSESDAWEGKEIGLFAIDQSVAGEIKKIVYAVAK